MQNVEFEPLQAADLQSDSACLKRTIKCPAKAKGVDIEEWTKKTTTRLSYGLAALQILWRFLEMSSSPIAAQNAQHPMVCTTFRATMCTGKRCIHLPRALKSVALMPRPFLRVLG